MEVILEFNKRDFLGGRGGFIFLNDPDNVFEQLNPMFNIVLTRGNGEDLVRYVTKLFYDKDIPVDYSKQIRIALDFYLKKHIGEKEEKEIAKMKAEEARAIEEARKKEIPKFDWDRSKRKEIKNES